MATPSLFWEGAPSKFHCRNELYCQLLLFFWNLFLKTNVVYRCCDAQMETKVAIKTLNDESGVESEKDFFKEVEIMQ